MRAPEPNPEIARFVVPLFYKPQKGTVMTNPYEHLDRQELVALDNMYGIIVNNRTVEIEELRGRIKQLNAEIRAKEDHVTDVKNRHRQVIDVITSRPAFTVTPQPGTDDVLITTADEEVLANPKHVKGVLKRINEIVAALNKEQGR